MSERLSKLQCVKCAAEAAPDQHVCGRCGSRVVKICGKCDFKNSAAKNYCDQCGEPFTMEKPRGGAPASPKDPPPPPQPPPSPDRELPKTSIVRLGERGPKPQAGPPQPAPRSSPAAPPPQRHEPPVSEPSLPRAPARPGEGHPPKGPAAPPATVSSRAGLASTVAGLVLLVAGAALYGWYWRYKRQPQVQLGKTANRYLAALQNRDFAAAYALLSAPSRESCPLEDYRLGQDMGTWTSSPPVLSAVEAEWALVAYDSSAPGSPPVRDWLHFVREEDRRTRAYWWHLQPRIEAALERADAAAATEAARRAARINPRDALVRAYLCEAAYLREDAVEAERECSEAFALAGRTPSRLNDDRLYHLHSLLADVYRNQLGKLDKAEREYDILLAFPRLSVEDACEVRLARGDARVLRKDFARAAEDFAAAGGLCALEEDAAYAGRAAAVLGGRGGEDAVAAVQRHRMPDESTLLEWRAKVREGLTKSKGKAFKPPEEAWEPAHEGGPVYTVRVRSGEDEVLKASVDLWEHTVKVDMHVQ